MYFSPIHVDYIKPIVEKMQDEFDNEVLRAVQKVNIEVDKDELVKALKYDRQQYEKGFSDGLAYKPPICTNADRINAMSVEEKADCLNDIWHHLVFGNDAPGPCGMCHEISISSCRACWLDWVKQEVSE